MTETVSITFNKSEFEDFIINCFNACLKHSELNYLPKSETSQWLDLDQLCNYHPDKPRKQTVYGWVSAGTVPHHKDGKKLRFLKSEIDEWLKQGRKKTIAEIASEADEYLATKKKTISAHTKMAINDKH